MDIGTIAGLVGTIAGVATMIAGTYATRNARTVGGLTFIRFGRVQLSVCVVRRVPAKRINFATGS
jgi:hypothetical protein